MKTTKTKTKMMRLLLALGLMLAGGGAGAADAKNDPTPVRSKVIETFFYNHTNRTLTIHFRSGASYTYAGVPARVYRELVSAGSIGHYYSTEIRGKFASRRLQPAASANAVRETESGDCR